MKKILLILAFCALSHKINARDISQLPLGDELYAVMILDVARCTALFQISCGMVTATESYLSAFEEHPFDFIETKDFEILNSNLEKMIDLFKNGNVPIIVNSIARIRGLLLQAKDFKTTYQDEASISRLILISKFCIKQEWETFTGYKSWEDPASLTGIKKIFETCS